MGQPLPVERFCEMTERATLTVDDVVLLQPFYTSTVTGERDVAVPK